MLRQGNVRVAHFAHKANAECNQETVLHKTAKLLIQKAVRDWKEGHTGAPVVQRRCQLCYSTVNQPLPDKVDDATLEYRLSDGSVADVALMVRNTVQAIVEIKVTHAVDAVKADRLTAPFVELDANEVIADPLVWKPIIDSFKPLVCEKCKLAWDKFRAKTSDLARLIGIELPTDYYRYGIHRCWKCEREILVFTWPRECTHDDARPKVKPVPKTVQYRFSNTVGRKYWVNVCPYCQSIQGDFFLHCEPDGPFIVVNREEDAPSAFKQDLMKIAVHAAELGML